MKVVKLEEKKVLVIADKTKSTERVVCFLTDLFCVPGRAPVLVALALIECGMKYEDAVQFIRQ